MEKAKQNSWLEAALTMGRGGCIRLSLGFQAKYEYILPSIKPEDLSFKPGENASFFIVRDAKEDMYWVSETPEDDHLTVFFGVMAEKLSQNLTRYHVFTSVKYLHWTGRYKIPLLAV